MKEKIKFESKQIVSVEEDSREILDIAKKRDILIPSSHLGFFKTIYCEIEKPNLNGIILAREAVEKALPGLISAQVNFEHMQAGFLCGSILDVWINDNDEIEVVYAFYKGIYPDEYDQSIELAKEGKLAVSFELLSESNSQEHFDNGDIRLNDIDFQGMGHLMDNPPACSSAKIYEFAKVIKNRVNETKNKELMFASKIVETCDKILKTDKQSSDVYKDFPDSSFAVIEPAFRDGTSSDRKARHLPFKDRFGKFDLTNYRIALDIVNEILPITDSITTEELREEAKEELAKFTEILAKIKKEEEKLNQGGNTNMELTKEQKAKIEKIQEELGDLSKDVSDEDLLKDDKVAELRIVKAEADKTAKAKKTEEIAYKVDSVEIRTYSLEDIDGVETVVENIQVVRKVDYNAQLDAVTKVAELESTLEAKNSEIETVRENAEQIGKTKVQLKDNTFAKEFTDEEYLDDEKVAKAIQDQKNADETAKVVADRKEELKDNEFAKDFSDEDLLDDTKVELAKTKAENKELKAKVPDEDPEKIDASLKQDEDMSTGNPEGELSYEEVMATVRKDKNEKKDKNIKVRTK